MNVGMGFMPQHASEVLHACMAAGIYLYFENHVVFASKCETKSWKSRSCPSWYML